MSTTARLRPLTGVDVAVAAAPRFCVCLCCLRTISNQEVDVNLSKGMEAGSHKLMHEVAADELGNPARIAVLSGPNHAEEAIKQGISAAVVASEDAEA